MLLQANGVLLPWSILIVLQLYKYGINATPQPKLPEPFRFLWGSAAMGGCAIIAQANAKAGVLLAWGILVAAFVAAYNQPSTTGDTGVGIGAVGASAAKNLGGKS